ncbi:M48 family metalloprotease [Candidatus Halobonum tyrrellensis]|uniref:M48 family metalloprotease n=1 Tax=Candidatus Halobonum tyrrellensis TaxID=1431545 RepID=UPI001267DC7C|nr:M48 family metalloprotease [Candidatus Halobonum tyrrellensis]
MGSVPLAPLEAVAAWMLDWWELWTLIVAGFLGVRIAPRIAARTQRVGDLPAPVADAVAAVGVPADRVVVVDADDRVVAYAAGFSSRDGRVFVSTGLLAALAPAEAAAVVRHEYGHLARRHVPFRVGVPSAYAVAWAVDATLYGTAGLWAGAALALPLAYLSARVARWTEFDADAFAARAAGGAFADALTRLAEAGHLPDDPDPGPLARLSLSMHPTLAARLSRLGADRQEPTPAARRERAD